MCKFCTGCILFGGDASSCGQIKSSDKPIESLSPLTADWSPRLSTTLAIIKPHGVAAGEILYIVSPFFGHCHGLRSVLACVSFPIILFGGKQTTIFFLVMVSVREVRLPLVIFSGADSSDV